MGHAVGDIVQVTFRHSISNNQMMNVLHYRVESSSSVATDIADNQSFAEYIASQTGPGQWLEAWMAGTVVQFSMVAVRVQKISPMLTPYAEEPLTITGGIAGASGIHNIAVTVTKRGNLGGRAGIGSIHFAGLPEIATSNGRWAASISAWWTTIKPQFEQNRTVPLNNITYKPCIYNKGLIPPYNYILDWQYRDTVRTMHRRTLLVGV